MLFNYKFRQIILEKLLYVCIATKLQNFCDDTCYCVLQ